MKFATVEQVKKLRESGMRKKDKEFWGGDNLNVWLCWMGSVIKFLEERAERSAKVRKSVSVNSENSGA
jgi:hypothetical protein